MSRAPLALLRTPRYEVLPTPSTEQAVLEWVPRELTITITASPARGLEPTLALTERLAGHGYRVVPHLSARLVRDPAHLPHNLLYLICDACELTEIVAKELEGVLALHTAHCLFDVILDGL